MDQHSTEAYISLTCHFLTSQWEFVDCILATKCLLGHHTGENISATIKEVLTSYEIPESSVSSIVHDQGSNMRQASDRLYNEKDGIAFAVQLICYSFASAMDLKAQVRLTGLLVLLAN